MFMFLYLLSLTNGDQVSHDANQGVVISLDRIFLQARLRNLDEFLQFLQAAKKISLRLTRFENESMRIIRFNNKDRRTTIGDKWYLVFTPFSIFGVNWRFKNSRQTSVLKGLSCSLLP